MTEYDHMQWMKFMRRHESNIFNAFFFDNENITEEDLNTIISDIARFFDLPIPVINDRCEEMARIIMGENARDTELFYNIEMLKNAGINNKDAFTLCFVHEMAHQMLYTERFNLFRNERWMQELAADLTAGIYASLHLLSTGKFKYALSTQKPSLTHPDGKLREMVVDYGRIEIEKNRDVKCNMVNRVRNLIPAFFYIHCRQMKNDWKQVAHDLEYPPQPVTQKEIRIEDLPESNLIKQAIQKYNKQKGL